MVVFQGICPFILCRQISTIVCDTPYFPLNISGFYNDVTFFILIIDNLYILSFSDSCLFSLLIFNKNNLLVSLIFLYSYDFLLYNLFISNLLLFISLFSFFGFILLLFFSFLSWNLRSLI